MERTHKVKYYETYFDRYGDKEMDVVVTWVSENEYYELKNDPMISELEIIEIENKG